MREGQAIGVAVILTPIAPVIATVLGSGAIVDPDRRIAAGNAPELTTSRKRRRLRRMPSRIPHIRPVRQARKFSEGGGLYLLVVPTGGRYWRYNYRFKGKQKTLALGVCPDVPLEKARARHEKARRLLAAGIDPVFAQTRLTAILDSRARSVRSGTPGRGRWLCGQHKSEGE